MALEWHGGTASDPETRINAEADDGGRTRDLRLGKPALYQLSYVREAWIVAVLRGPACRPVPRSDPNRLQASE